MTEKEVKNQWVLRDKQRALFWVSVEEYLGHLDDSHAAAHAACAVDSMKEFEGSLDDAIALIVDFAAADAEHRKQAALAGIKTLSVTYERKFNLGNYESLHVGMTSWTDVHDDTTAEEVQAELWKWVKEAVKEQALPVIDAAKQPTSQTKAPTAIEPPAPSSGPWQMPTAGPGNAVPPPPAPGSGEHVPPLPPSQPVGALTGNEQTQPNGNGGGTETFRVDSITAQVSPNGNRYYAVRGGRVKKHGATAWPEIAEPQLEALTGYDPINLEIGKPWDVTGFGIRAVGEIPPGKTYPNKITAFAPST